MKRLLLAASLLAFASPAMSESWGDSVVRRWDRHIKNIEPFFDAGDFEMGCSEARNADFLMKMYFSEMQAAYPDVDWFQQRKNQKKS